MEDAHVARADVPGPKGKGGDAKGDAKDEEGPAEEMGEEPAGRGMRKRAPPPPKEGGEAVEVPRLGQEAGRE